MSKVPKRWPLWKNAGAGVLCIVVAVLLFLGSGWMERAVDASGAPDSGSADVLPLSGFLMILGMAVSMLALIVFIRLGLRIKEARTPPWERPKKKKRFKRR